MDGPAAAMAAVVTHPVVAKVREVLMELAYLAAGHAVFARLLPAGGKPAATGLAMAALTAQRWSAENRRLLALAMLVRSAGIFQNLPPPRARLAVAATFALVSGELGRRYRGWPGPRPTLHPQFVTVMSRLSGMRDARAFALDPVAVGKGYTTVGAWAGAAARSARFALPLMATAYGLQEAVNLVIRALARAGRRRSGAAAAGRGRAGERGERGASGSGGGDGGSGGGDGGQPLAPGDPHRPPPRVKASRAREHVTKVLRTSGIYVYLGMYTVHVMFSGRTPAPHKSAWHSRSSLANTAWMSMFAVFALFEPVHRAAVLAEYYVMHLCFGMWTDLRVAAKAGLLPRWFLAADGAVLPLAAALAVAMRPGRMPMGLLDRAAAAWAAVV